MEILCRPGPSASNDCDPCLESCESGFNEAVVRPPNGLDLFNLTWSVTALEIAGPLITSILTSIVVAPYNYSIFYASFYRVTYYT